MSEKAGELKWIKCENCGQLTPEYLKTCFKCHAARVKPKPVPLPVPPPVPPTPQPAEEKCKKKTEEPSSSPAQKNWKQIISKIVAVGGTIATLISVASFFVPALAPVSAIIKSILAVISQIFVGV